MRRFILISLLLAAVLPLPAQVPQIINYQGKIAVGTTPFSGTGQFRFALVNGNGSASYWSNDGTSTAGGEPTAAVSLPVVNGLYIVPLGDATLANMTTIPATVFTNADVRVRVWFNDGSNGSQLLAPDQRITSVGYAMVASTVPDGAITTAKLAPAARPRHDRQESKLSGNVTVGTALTPVPGLSLTTKNLGESGLYRVEFQALVSGGAPSQAFICLNGVQITTSEAYAAGTNGWTTLRAVALVPNVSSGTVFTVRGLNSGTAFFFNPQLYLDGVPVSQVAP